MNHNNTVIKGPQFLKMLTEQNGRVAPVSPMVIEHDLSIDGQAMGGIKSICLENLTFTGSVSIRNFEKINSFTISSMTVLGGFYMCNVGGDYLSAFSMKAPWFNLLTCQFKGAHLTDVVTDGDLDISGLKLSSYLALSNLGYKELRLIHPSTGNFINVPMVKTDDFIAAFQFRMAGIPVVMSTVAARKFMESGANILCNS